MLTSLYNYLCNKFFSKEGENPRIREEDCNNQLYGKRIKLNDQSSATRDVLFTPPKLPMQSKENVENNKIPAEENEGCYVIAEVPRRKQVVSSLKLQSEGNAGGGNLLKQSNNWVKNPPQNNLPIRDLNSNNNNNDKDIEVIKYLNHNSNDDKGMIKNKVYKFFMTKRNSLSQSKVVKSKMEYETQLRKKLNFIQECYRLKEKYQYVQLLKSQTSCSLAPNNQQKPKELQGSSTIPVIDLTEDENNYGSIEFNAHSLIDVPPENDELVDIVKAENIQTADDDIQIIEEIPRIRSFEDILKNSPVKEELLPKSLASDSAKAALNMLEQEAVKLQNKVVEECTLTLEDKLQKIMQISDGEIKREEETTKVHKLPELTAEHKNQIQGALGSGPSQEILIEGFGLHITRKDLRTLKGFNWLNDEVINFYMNLIMERSKENKNLPKVFSFNTFFFTTLSLRGYQSVKRWTKEVDIFSYDLLLVPIHLKLHWCLSIIDFRLSRVLYFNSIETPDQTALRMLLLYLECERINKKKKFCLENWNEINVKDIPQQMNGSDCGVFACMFAEYYTRNASMLFTQDDMPYFRQKIIVECLNKKLMT